MSNVIKFKDTSLGDEFYYLGSISAKPYSADEVLRINPTIWVRQVPPFGGFHNIIIKGYDPNDRGFWGLGSNEDLVQLVATGPIIE